MSEPVVKTILSNLFHNKEYFVKVWPYLDSEYFDGPAKHLYESIKKYVDNYKSTPTKNAVNIILEDSTLPEGIFEPTKKLLVELESTPEDLEWLIDTTEKYVVDTALYNATSKAIQIQTNAKLPPEKRDKRLPDVGIIPDLMTKALSVSFNSDLGHDWLSDFEKRWMTYQTKINKIPFSLEIFNKITKGGVELGTLNIILAGTNVGKSLGLCSLAADYLSSGHDVAYISMEMSEIACAKRIDANLLDVSLDDLDTIGTDNPTVSYQELKGGIDRLAAKTLGKLKIKQFPTGGANANTFRAYLSDLELKENFKPKIVIVDYLGICSSSRLKTFSENSYTLVKAIAEELRGLAVEKQLVVWTAAQTTRAGWDSSDISMSDVAECIHVDSKVETPEGKIKIKDVKTGDLILSHDGFRPVIQVSHKKTKEVYKIKTKSGKEILVSSEHIFPTQKGRLSISKGLKVGDFLNVKK